MNSRTVDGSGVCTCCDLSPFSLKGFPLRAVLPVRNGLQKADHVNRERVFRVKGRVRAAARYPIQIWTDNSRRRDELLMSCCYLYRPTSVVSAAVGPEARPVTDELGDVLAFFRSQAVCKFLWSLLLLL